VDLTVRWRQVCILWLVAAALAAQYAVVERRRPVAHPAERPARRRVLPDLAREAVVAIRMERGVAAVALRRYGETWSVEQPTGGQVPAGLVDAFVESLASVEEIERVPVEPAHEATFGLDESALRVYVTDVHGGEVELTIGGSNAAGTAVYARVGDADHAVLIGRNLSYYASLILQEVQRSTEPPGDGPVA
jgi:hypothetical protein